MIKGKLKKECKVGMEVFLSNVNSDYDFDVFPNVEPAATSYFCSSIKKTSTSLLYRKS